VEEIAVHPVERVMDYTTDLIPNIAAQAVAVDQILNVIKVVGRFKSGDIYPAFSL